MLKHVLVALVGLSIATAAFAEKKDKCGDNYGTPAYRQCIREQASKQISNANRPGDTTLKIRCWNKMGRMAGGGEDLEYREKAPSGGIGAWFSGLFRRKPKPEPVVLDDAKEYEMYVYSNKMANWETPVVIITPDGKKVAVKLDGTGNNCNIDKKYKSSEDYMEQEVWSKPEYQEQLKKEVKKTPKAKVKEIWQECSNSRDSFSPGFKQAFNNSGIQESSNPRGDRTQEGESSRPAGGGAGNNSNGQQ